jgi:hypothetical protein
MRLTLNCLAMQMHYQLSAPEMMSMAYLSWLSRLKEMTLWLSVYNPDDGEVDGDYEADNNFPELKRLSIGCVCSCSSLLSLATLRQTSMVTMCGRCTDITDPG